MEDAPTAPVPDVVPEGVSFPVKTPVWPAFAVLALAFTAMLSGSMVPMVLKLVWMGATRQPLPKDLLAILITPTMLIATTACSQLSILLSALILPRLFRDVGQHGFAARVKWHWSRFSLVDTLAMAAMAVGGGQLLEWFLVEVLQLPVSPNLKALSDAMHSASWAQFAALLPLIGIAPGFCEELLFRGYAQNRLIERFGAAKGITLTTLLFVGFHLDPMHMLGILPVAFVLGFGAHRGQTIASVIVVHAINNSTSVLLSRFTTDVFWQQHAREALIGSALLVTAGAAVWFATRNRSFEGS
jgi:uncharacterized protein